MNRETLFQIKSVLDCDPEALDRLPRLAMGIYAFLAAWPLAIAQGPAAYPDLPPLEQVSRALENYPPVAEAKSKVRLEQANRRFLEAGVYEYSVNLSAQRRAVDPTERFTEWGVAVERPLRIGKKAELDKALGEQGVSTARIALGDALHEAARNLLKSWFAWQKEQAQAVQWRRQAELLEKQAALVERRVKAGDAAPMEANLARAAAAQAEAAWVQARVREQAARVELAKLFPEIALPGEVPQVDPEPMIESLDDWRGRILTHNHLLALMRAEVMKARLVASRAGAGVVPDPTVGVRYASERSGAERITGLFVSVPLPGEARRARAQGAAAEAQAAAQREALALRRLEAELARAYASARGAYESWLKAQAAAGGMGRNAASVARAYELGETALPDVLTAQRLAVESALAAALARIEAREARYRLMLDAHQLWPLDVAGEDEEHEHY